MLYEVITNAVALLKENGRGLYTLFLKHRPVPEEGTEGLFDLQLSGHTHRGQIFPFNYLTAIMFPMQDGLYPLSKGSFLYASRGTGTWGPPMRLFSPPEITLFEIVSHTERHRITSYNVCYTKLLRGYINRKRAFNSRLFD